MTRKKETTTQQLTKPANASVSKEIPVGRPPSAQPPRVADYEELDKKAIDILVDSLKYVATSSGIVIAMYSQTLREYVKLPAVASRPAAQVLLFLPLLLWFSAIVGTVLGIFPRQHRAVSDVEKERVVRRLRRTKILWVRVVLVLFLLGFSVFLYVIGAQIWIVYPFS